MYYRNYFIYILILYYFIKVWTRVHTIQYVIEIKLLKQLNGNPKKTNINRKKRYNNTQIQSYIYVGYKNAKVLFSLSSW